MFYFFFNISYLNPQDILLFGREKSLYMLVQLLAVYNKINGPTNNRAKDHESRPQQQDHPDPGPPQP